MIECLIRLDNGLTQTSSEDQGDLVAVLMLAPGPEC